MNGGGDVPGRTEETSEETEGEESTKVAGGEDHGDLEEDENTEREVVDRVSTELMSLLKRRPKH